MSDTTDDDLEWEEWNPSRISFVNHMIAGSIAGLAEHISLFPVDTIKTHIQCERCGSISPIQTWNCATNIVGKEGIFRLWRGVTAMFAGCIPAHAAYFSVFETMKAKLGANTEGHHPIEASVCGALAAISHDLFMTPFDMVKQRMQLGYYRNVYHCFSTVIRTEGVKALYLSFPTTLLMNIPYGCIMVPVNESMKKYLNPSNSYNFTASMASGCIAGAVAAALTNPLDVVKTKLQIQNLQPCPNAKNSLNKAVININNSLNKISNNSIISNSSNSGSINSNNNSNSSKLVLNHYKTTGQTIVRIWQEEGPRGFLRGAVPRVMVHAPAVAISWTAYEFAKSILYHYN